MNTNSQIQFSVSGRWWQPNMETWRLLTTLPHIPPSPSNSSCYLVMCSKMLFFYLLTYLDLIPLRPRPNITYPYKYSFYGYHEENEQTVRLCNFLPWIYLSFVNYFVFFHQNILYFSAGCKLSLCANLA